MRHAWRRRSISISTSQRLSPPLASRRAFLRALFRLYVSTRSSWVVGIRAHRLILGFMSRSLSVQLLLLTIPQDRDGVAVEPFLLGDSSLHHGEARGSA